MSLTVAPLTAAVMGSVSDHFSGTASGINNAMTRISGVFANAIFGALAVVFFSGALQQQLKTVGLNAKDKQAIIQQAADLGNAKVPPTIPQTDQLIIKKAYHVGFITAYANIMRISAALGFLGALMALVFIRSKRNTKPSLSSST
jgi:preprotein translocase subunit SecG